MKNIFLSLLAFYLIIIICSSAALIKRNDRSVGLVQV